MYDLPDGSWDMEREDADRQQADLYAAGRRYAALKRKGICPHGGGGPVDLAAYKAGTDMRFRCAECGAIFPTDDAMHAAHAELMGGGDR